MITEDLLPLSLAGIFLNLHDLYPTQFFSCPTTPPDSGGAISGNVDYTRRRSTLPDGHIPSINITGHCNGLVLVNNCVTNPATRRFNAVREHLVFDPAVSPAGGYEVFLIPRERTRRRRDEFYPTSEESEWPPSPFFLSVFSSETRQWLVRRFNISLSSDKYQVIGPLISFDVCRYKEFHLGRSEKGWVLKLDNNLKPILPLFKDVKLSDDGPWSLQDIDYCEDPNEDDDAKSQTVQETNYDWDFDSGANSIDIQAISVQGRHRGFGFLGFHPFKEVVFLHYSLERGLAYNLNSFKVQDLGNLCPKDYGFDTEPYVESCFPYTPCWMEVFPEEQI
uniref:Uncharacterized protein n=1 Tax=Oryza punctata TaxID=4537 RepID=A0A0E0KG71_ORYPU